MATAPQSPFDPFDAAPDPMAILAPDGALLRANPAFRAAFRQWIGPNRPPWGRTEPPEFENDLRRFDAPAPDGRRLEWVERRFADGVRLISARDVTTRVAAAEEAGRAKTTLFATLTHELRTPLNGVLGMAGLLSQTKLEPAQDAYVAAIRKSGEHLLDIITEILDYSRFEAGGVTLDNAPFDVEATLQSVAELLSPMAHAKKLEIAVLMRPGAPQRVIGDDGRLRQILFNLAGNAVKFTEAGGVVLECARGGEGRIRLTVRDSGAGIPPELQTRIFEEFAQADASTARRHGGAGLGLAIVKKLAHAMGGEAGLVSRPGQGSAFWVELPLPESADAEHLPMLDGVRVSIVSPSRFYANVLAASLEAMGAEIIPRGAHADVALVDGVQTITEDEAEAIKKTARAVIALTPQVERAAIARGRSLGIWHYVVKPLRRKSLVERVRMALGDAANERATMHEDEDPLAPGALSGLRVLLAEDNPINALLARTLLGRAGCVVDVVSDGEEAVAAVAEAPYDIVFLDLRMPRLDGYGAAKKIRALGGASANTPLVALTAEAGDSEKAAALAAGMNDFVTKPINPTRLGAVAARFTPGAKAATV